MKKAYLITCMLVVCTLIAIAQPHRDALPGEVSENSFDIMSLAIGAVVGVVIGYIVGKRSAQK